MNQVVKKDAVQTVAQLLTSQKSQIMAALPRHLDPDRFARIALTEIRKNPDLGECDPLSFLGAVIQAAQLGLEPGSGLGHAFLIPFWNNKKRIREVVFMPGYRGLIDLARRSGQVASITARPVFQRDKFRIDYGDDEKIYHEPFQPLVNAEGETLDTPENQPGPVIAVYAIGRLNGGGIQREVMWRKDIESIRSRGRDNSVWKTDFNEMARKTVVRRICKYLPMSPELARAIEADDQTFKGESQENWKVIDAAYEPQPAKSDPEKIKEATSGGLATSVGEDAQERIHAVAEFNTRSMEAKKLGCNIHETVGALDMEKSPLQEIYIAIDKLIYFMETTGSAK